MKKKLAIIIPVVVIALIVAISIVYMKTKPPALLSQAEIDMLRKEYPINDQEPPLICMFPMSLEENIRYCDSYAEVEIVSERTVHTRMLADIVHVKYEVRIVEDVFNSIQQDTIEIAFNRDLEIGMPVMEVGSRFLVGGVYNTEYGTIDIGSETMFYVTDDGYILSVRSEASRNQHTGSKAEDFFDYLQTVKEKDADSGG